MRRERRIPREGERKRERKKERDRGDEGREGGRGRGRERERERERERAIPVLCLAAVIEDILFFDEKVRLSYLSNKQSH